MFRTAFTLLSASRARMTITVFGIALCILLMSFLVGIYRGVSDGSIEYIRTSDADVWILQQVTTNILRGFSLLTKAHGSLLRDWGDVESVSPVLFRLSTIETERGPATTYLTGFEPGTRGGPPRIQEGSTIAHRGEIVLDAAFAQRWGCNVGDSVRIMDSPFVVVGLSGGSNMFVIQYAFTHIDDVRNLYAVNDLVSAYLVTLKTGSDTETYVRNVRNDVPGIAAFDRTTFLRLNITEMENGFLPIILVMMMISAVLLTIIIGLLLTMNVLEHRGELAVFRAIGAPFHYLPLLIFFQSFQLVAIAAVLSVLLGIPLTELIGGLAPEVSVQFAPTDLVLLFTILVMLIGAGTAIPLVRLRGIYPAEAFT